MTTTESGSKEMATNCPNAAGMGEHACDNAAQCFEPCGKLGKSEHHVRRASPQLKAALAREFTRR